MFTGARAAAFQGLEVAVPARPEAFLEAVYGDWTVPEAKVHYLYGPLNVEVEVQQLPPAAPPARGIA